MWPGAYQFGSEIGSVQQMWAGVLSLSWLCRQGKVWDLRLGENGELLVRASKGLNWSKAVRTKLWYYWQAYLKMFV